MLLWAPKGSQQAGGIAESGLNLVHTVVTLGPGDRMEGSFETKIAGAVQGGRLRLRLVPQPRLVPMDLDVRIVEAGGWNVRDPPSWQGPWDRTVDLSWRVDR